MKPFVIITFAPLEALSSLRLQYGDRLSDYRRAKLCRIAVEAERERGELAEYCLIAALRRADPAIALPLAIGTETHGKPFLIGSDVRISLSHAGNFAAAAVSSAPIGVDIERTRPASEALLRRICTDREWEQMKHRTDEAFRDLFSAKEALVKRSGEGLRDIRREDVTTTNAVRQLRFSDYVLSVASECTCEWEVLECEKDGAFCLRSFY